MESFGFYAGLSFNRSRKRRTTRRRTVPQASDIAPAPDDETPAPVAPQGAMTRGAVAAPPRLSCLELSMSAFDSLGRRRRTRPISTGKRITPGPTDLVWFRKLYEHGPLPSSFLFAFTRHLRRSDKRSLERLTDLFNEAGTPNGGRYLDRPPQQFRTIDSRYNQLVYDVTPAAVRALADADELPSHVPNPSGPWPHRFMVACVNASIEIATLDRPDLSYIPGHRVLARAVTTLRYPVTITEPATGRPLTKDLIPDALFGLEYHTSEGSRFRFFVVECDRATEPVTSRNWNRKSWQRSLLQYQAYVGGVLYREHLRLSAPLLVLNVTSDTGRMEKMVAVTEKAARAPAHLLFQTWIEFGPVSRPPSPRTDLLNEPWRRANRCNFGIGRT